MISFTIAEVIALTTAKSPAMTRKVIYTSRETAKALCEVMNTPFDIRADLSCGGVDILFDDRLPLGVMSLEDTP